MQIIEVLSAANAANVRDPEDALSQLELCSKAVEQLADGKHDVPRSKIVELVLFWISWGGAGNGEARSAVSHTDQLHRAASQLLQVACKSTGPFMSAREVQGLIALLKQTLSLWMQYSGVHHTPTTICVVADALAAVPQLTSIPERTGVAVAALDAIVCALNVATRDSVADRVAAQSVVVYRLLKALQLLLAQAKKDHGCNLGNLVPILQQLLSFGIHQPTGVPGQGLGVTPKPLHGQEQAPSLLAPQPGKRLAPPPASCGRQQVQAQYFQRPGTVGLSSYGSNGSNSKQPSESSHCSAGGDTLISVVGRGRAYVPPHLRAPPAGQHGGQSQPKESGFSTTLLSTTHETSSSSARDVGSSLGSAWGWGASAAAGPRPLALQRQEGVLGRQAVQGRSPRLQRPRSMETSDPSDSEPSDSEGGGLTSRATRVRLAALAVLQALAKADSKSLHPSWTLLLPSSDSVLVSPGAGGQWTLGHVLLHDPIPRVRQAAAVTINIVLEGPAQRAYMGIAECSGLHGQRTRGFISLSMSLGMVATVLHAVLLRALRGEADSAVQLSVLRALCTLLLAAPYHRLPHDLLPSCVEALHQALAEHPPAVRPHDPFQQPSDAASVAAACLSCLAAAFSTRQPSRALHAFLCAPSIVGRAAVVAPGEGAQNFTSTPAVVSSLEEEQPGGRQTGGQPEGAELVQLVFRCAGCGNPAIELEAVMALRGLAHLYCSALAGSWDKVLGLAKLGAAFPSAGTFTSPRAQQGGSIGEKLAHQSVRLAGDWLAAMAPLDARLTPSEEPLGQLDRGPAGARRGPRAAQCGASMGGLVGSPAGEPGSEAPAWVGKVDCVAQHAQRWREVAESVLRGGFRQDSSLVRGAAYSVVATIAPPMTASLSAALQLQLLRWCARGAAVERASSERAAAAKALGALCRAAHNWRDFTQGLNLVIPALHTCCADSTLAVRVQAAAALAEFCRSLQVMLGRNPVLAGAPGWQHQQQAQQHQPQELEPFHLAGGASAAAARLCPPVRVQGGGGGRSVHMSDDSQGAEGDGSKEKGGWDAAHRAARGESVVHDPASVMAAISTLPPLLCLAASAAGDSEKVQGSGADALGCLFACLGGCVGGYRGLVTAQSLPHPTPQSVGQASIALGDVLSSDVPKIQWNACTAAGQLLASCSQAASLCGGDAACSHCEGSAAWVRALLGHGCDAVRALQRVFVESHSMRSRILAAVSLQQISTPSWCAPVFWELLEASCQALFDGDSENPAGAAIDQSDAALKPRLEAEQLHLLLHLLALLSCAEGYVHEVESVCGSIRLTVECTGGLDFSVYQERISALLLAAVCHVQSASASDSKLREVGGELQEPFVKSSIAKAWDGFALKQLLLSPSLGVCSAAPLASLGWLRLISASAAGGNFLLSDPTNCDNGPLNVESLAQKLYQLTIFEK